MPQSPRKKGPSRVITLCWFYCVPFAKFLYFAAAPFVFLVALFVLKRGIYRARKDLRQTAFFLMFAAVFKFFIFDLYMIKDDLFCATKAAAEKFVCTTAGLRLVEFVGVLLALAASAVLFHFYRVLMPGRKVRNATPEQVRLGFWTKTAFITVLLLAVWQTAPWVSYLTVGSVPPVFSAVPWPFLAALGFGLILTGFWKAEGCASGYRLPRRGYKNHAPRGLWSPRDMLWTSMFIYLLTLAMSYVSHDFLSGN